MKLKPYPEYQDSGVPWLGRIPTHWPVLRIKNIFRETDERSGNGKGILLSLTRARGLLPQTEATNRLASAEDLSKYKVCKPRQLVMNRMQAWSGMFAVSSQEGLVSPDYSVFRADDTAEVSYFEYLFKTPLYVDQFAQYSKGIGSGFNRLYTPDFGAIQLMVPPKEEQKRIIGFLTYFDRRINRLIRAKRRLIELLNEQKQAIIHRAVTRGLDPNGRLKPSGIDWLPEIPEQWISVRAETLALSLQTGPFGSQLHAHDYKPNGIPVINPSHMQRGRITADPDCAIDPDKAAELSRHRLRPGDIVFARRGELGRCALVGEREAGWLCGTGSLRMRLKAQVAEPEYLIQLFLSKGVAEWLSLQSVGSTMENLNTGILARLPLPLPPQEEQQAIVSHLVEQQAVVDAAINRARREIDLLHEYRTRLIADVVTGKLDVRGVELPALDEVNVLDDRDTAEDAEADEMNDSEEALE